MGRLNMNPQEPESDVIQTAAKWSKVSKKKFKDYEFYFSISILSRSPLRETTAGRNNSRIRPRVDNPMLGRI